MQIRVCVLEDGRLRALTATRDPATGELMHDGEPVRDLFPHPDAAAASRLWYINNEPIWWEDRRFIRYGMPRPLSPDDLRPTGEYDGVALFTEAAHPSAPEILFVPVRPGCEFQAYQWDLTGLGVRGG